MNALSLDIWSAVKDRYELAIQNGGNVRNVFLGGNVGRVSDYCVMKRNARCGQMPLQSNPVR